MLTNQNALNCQSIRIENFWENKPDKLATFFIFDLGPVFGMKIDPLLDYFQDRIFDFVAIFLVAIFVTKFCCFFVAI